MTKKNAIRNVARKVERNAKKNANPANARMKNAKRIAKKRKAAAKSSHNLHRISYDTNNRPAPKAGRFFLADK
jgi:hypothetical protein